MSFADAIKSKVLHRTEVHTAKNVRSYLNQTFHGLEDLSKSLDKYEKDKKSLEKLDRQFGDNIKNLKKGHATAKRIEDYKEEFRKSNHENLAQFAYELKHLQETVCLSIRNAEFLEEEIINDLQEIFSKISDKKFFDYIQKQDHNEYLEILKFIDDLSAAEDELRRHVRRQRRGRIPRIQAVIQTDWRYLFQSDKSIISHEKNRIGHYAHNNNYSETKKRLLEQIDLANSYEQFKHDLNDFLKESTKRMFLTIQLISIADIELAHITQDIDEFKEKEEFAFYRSKFAEIKSNIRKFLRNEKSDVTRIENKLKKLYQFVPKSIN